MVERVIEKFIFTSRWLLAPFCILLVLALFGLLLKTFVEVFHFAEKFLDETESGVILNTLSVVDLTLTASLLIIVIFAVYENFVSRIDATEHPDWPEWMASIDFTGLKLKLISSIVAISGIQLLRNFMNMGQVSDRDIGWSIAIHLTFVLSGLLMALTDRAAHGKHDT
jgi:uncharacterized protein (TIGR00645 family)